MPTLPVLHNYSSAPVAPLKNPASAADAADAGGEGQKSGSFKELLGYEMNGKDDIPNAGSADGDIVLNKDIDGATTGGVAWAEEMAERTADIQDSDKEAANILATVASPFIAHANMPPSRITAYFAGNSTGGKADAPIHALTDATAEFIAESTQPGLTVIASQQVQIPALLSGVDNARPGDKSGADPIMKANDRSAPRTTGGDQLSTDILAGLVAEAPTTARRAGSAYAVVKGETSISSSLNAREGVFSRLKSDLLEARLPEASLVMDLDKAVKFQAEVVHQGLPAAQVEAAMVAIAAERGPASLVSTATAGAPVHIASALELRLGASGWDNALGQKVLWMVSQQQQVAELSLNPPDLGPLQVVLSINGDQASAMFVSQQADVRQALEAALPRLKEMMAENGINLSSTTVGSDSPQQHRESEKQGRSGARYDGDLGRANEQGSDIGAMHIRRGENSLVDTFA